ncbi:MAG: toxin-antitoxin system HicB family antitoxin [Bacteroidales bacterium]|nr:toxin-antitoxin system HicB family antitoxin [Bacteroidales bacterium]
METARVSTIIRLRPELLDRAKRRAKQSHLSLNAFVERTLERTCEPEWPVFPPDFKVSDEILSFAIKDFKYPTREELEADPRLAHIWEEYGYEG